MKSISLRYPNLILPLTAGFDSRLLFLSSLDINCEYYVSQHKWMNDSHPDIIISKQLTSLFGKKLVIKKIQRLMINILIMIILLVLIIQDIFPFLKLSIIKL